MKLCYCEVVKNITVSVPDEVYRRARIAAAERGRSVSALVAEFLEQLTSRKDELARLAELERDVAAEIRRAGRRFSASSRLSREELYDRALRRH